MIKAIVFDLDGTLVQTEILKARSYARAAVDLSEKKISEVEVIEAFKDVVGKSRKEVAVFLLKKFDLEHAAAAQTERFGVKEAWQAFVQVRMEIYQKFLDEPRVLKKYLCPYNMQLLKFARKSDYKTGLATMSHCAQANRVLDILEIKNYFDFVATRDDVEQGKPDPEIYLLMAQELDVEPQECLVIEDSLNGVRAAISAGTSPLAVVTDFTREAVVRSGAISLENIVNEPKNLLRTAKDILTEKCDD
ncbi:MAG: HAD family phosphatase [Calditrichaeota bacterium]|nr:HAD family phosphatase [Calditrichota bacterium]